MPRIEEGVKKVGAYLAFRKDVALWIVEKEEALKKLEVMREQYVSAQLREFDRGIRLIEEQKSWLWSPLYCVMKNSSPTDWTPRPSEHTNGELECIIAALADEDQENRFSLEYECPPIIRAFKLYIRQGQGTNRPLGHPCNGLTFTASMGFTRSTLESVRLTVVVEDFIRHGWLFFPTIYSADEPLEQCRTNLLA
jgi:hypothetical protein